MRRLFLSILIGVIACSICFVGGAIYLAVWLDIGKTVDDQVALVRDHVESRLWTFVETLAEDEREIQARLRLTLPVIGYLAVRDRREPGTVSAEEREPEAWGLDEIRIIERGAIAREGLNGDDVTRLTALVGTGLVFLDVMAVSPAASRLQTAAYYSPRDADFLIRAVVNVHDFGRRERTRAHRDYLFGTFFSRDAPTRSFLWGVDVFIVNDRGSFSCLRDGRRLPDGMAEALEHEREARLSDGDRLSILSRIDNPATGLRGVRYAVIQTDFNLSVVNEPWRRLGLVIPALLAATGLGAALVFRRLFDRLLLRRVNAIVAALKAISAGDYAGAVTVSGSDELTAIGSAVETMRVRLQDRDRELAEAHDGLERRVAERTRELEREIETRKAYEQQLREVAVHDGLTRLSNRRAFDERGQREISRAARYHRALALVMLDIDHFKLVNDRYGHPVGDEVLQAVAAVIGSHGRAHDLVARIGGEEFAILMPEAELDAARLVAERVRTSIEDQHIITKAGALRVTVSLGVAAWSPAFAALPEFMAAADVALYQAKNGGRNRVCVAA